MFEVIVRRQAQTQQEGLKWGLCSPIRDLSYVFIELYLIWKLSLSWTFMMAG